LKTDPAAKEKKRPVLIRSLDSSIIRDKNGYVFQNITSFYIILWSFFENAYFCVTLSHLVRLPVRRFHNGAPISKHPIIEFIPGQAFLAVAPEDGSRISGDLLPDE